MSLNTQQTNTKNALVDVVNKLQTARSGVASDQATCTANAGTRSAAELGVVLASLDAEIANVQARVDSYSDVSEQ